MKFLKITAISALFLLSLTACKKSESKQNQSAETSSEKITNEKLVTLSGGISETVSALGFEKNIVGTDVTSTYPESLKTTSQNLGHVRNMTIEPLMALNPTIILASEKDMNPELLKKLKDSGIKFELMKQEYSVDGTKKLIHEVADVLGSNKADSLIKKMDGDLAQMQALPNKPKVLFIYARGNTLMVSGKDTPMAKIIEIAGGGNAVNDFADFKPMTPEALLEYNPDVLLFFKTGLESEGGVDGLLKMPGIAQTKAGKNKNIIAMDGGLLSSFGPRLGEAALELNKLLAKTK